VSISDTGIGIPEDKLSQLFDSFSQVDASNTRKYGGTGLGLSIAKKLSELMGGSIAVSSELGKGSCFSFDITLRKSQESQAVIPDVDLKNVNMLIVDDNSTNREVLRGQLTHWGAKVTEAINGVDALSLCEKQMTKTPFDIAIIDMQMPEMDGADLGKRFRSNSTYDNMKMVMMTSISNRGDADLFAKIGFNAYFPKPATTTDLFYALSILTTGGEVETQATPLVTSHYVKSLKNNEAEKTTKDIWPNDTRILLVEDNRVNQLVAKGILKNLGLAIDIAANGLEAINSLKKALKLKPYTLVLMDCQMPEMDGYEATRQIRLGNAESSNTGIPIIAMTANAMQGDKEKCFEAGMSDYLAKPISPEKIKNMLTKWLVEIN